MFGSSMFRCAVVLTMIAAGAPSALANHMEFNTDRPGSDYANFDLEAANPQLCQARCDQDGNCRAWTYVQPGVQGPNARCWLKSTVPYHNHGGCCVSGVK